MAGCLYRPVEGLRAASESIRLARVEHGFFYVTNHAVDRGLPSRCSRITGGYSTCLWRSGALNPRFATDPLITVDRPLRCMRTPVWSLLPIPLRLICA
jgi:hypothetical protein